MTTLPQYRTWDDVPANLKTKTQLGKLGLRLAPGQQPLGYKYSPAYGKWALYDMALAEPKHVMTAAQTEALEKAKMVSEARRTCQGCGYVVPLGERKYKYRLHYGFCGSCRAEAEREERDAARHLLCPQCQQDELYVAARGVEAGVLFVVACCQRCGWDSGALDVRDGATEFEAIKAATDAAWPVQP